MLVLWQYLVAARIIFDYRTIVIVQLVFSKKRHVIFRCMATAASLLALIDAAIEALLTGGASSYSIGARTVTKLDLATLMEERRQLQIQVQRETGSGGISLGKLTRHRR